MAELLGFFKTKKEYENERNKFVFTTGQSERESVESEEGKEYK